MNNNILSSSSLEKHVILFRANLSHLIEQMKELIFLDIRGKTHEQKVQPYRSMIQTLFPHCRSSVEIFRCTLWF